MDDCCREFKDVLTHNPMEAKKVLNLVQCHHTHLHWLSLNILFQVYSDLDQVSDSPYYILIYTACNQSSFWQLHHTSDSHLHSTKPPKFVPLHDVLSNISPTRCQGSCFAEFEHSTEHLDYLKSSFRCGWDFQITELFQDPNSKWLTQCILPVSTPPKNLMSKLFRLCAGYQLIALSFAAMEVDPVNTSPLPDAAMLSFVSRRPRGTAGEGGEFISLVLVCSSQQASATHSFYGSSW